MLKKEKRVFGAASARRRTTARSGAACVPKGKATIATWPESAGAGAAMLVWQKGLIFLFGEFGKKNTSIEKKCVVIVHV